MSPDTKMIAKRRPAVTGRFVMLLLAGCTTGTSQIAAPAPGLVVERTVRRADGPGSGLEAGDILRSWRRGESQAPLQTPFDLAGVELEQSPRGGVVVFGQHGNQEASWPYEPALWEVITRPNMTENLLNLYRRAEKLAQSEEIADARQAYRAAAELAALASQPAVSAWILYQGAEALARVHDWAGCDEAYRAALDRVPRDAAAARSFLLRAWSANFISRRDWAETERILHEALTVLAEDAEVALTRAATSRALGALARRRGELKQGEQLYGEALAIRRREAPGSIDVARSLNDLGALAQDRNDIAECRRYYTEALEIAGKAAPGSLDVARNLIGLGFIELYRDTERAAEYYRSALAIQERLAPGSLNVAQSLISLGIAAFTSGDLARSQEYYMQALEIERRLAPRSRDAALCLFNLANAVRARGDLTAAETYNREALGIFEEASPANLDVARVLTNLGLIAKDRGDLQGAENHYRRSLEIKQKLVPNSLPVAVSLNNLGNLYQQRGDLEKASSHLREALTLFQKLAPESGATGACLFSLGEAEFAAHRPDTAESYFRAALAIDEKTAPDSLSHAESLERVARMLRARGNLAEAEPLMKRSLAALESQTARLGGNEELRAAFRAKHAGFYRSYIEVLLGRGKTGEAFHALERSRARSFLAMLAERDTIFGADMPAALRGGLKQNATAYDRLEAQISGLDGVRDRDRIAGLRNGLERLATERAELIEQVRLASPRLAAVRYPQPVTVAEGAAALDPGTVLLSYSVGEQETTLFVLRKTAAEPQLEWHSLPVASAELRARVEHLRDSIQKPGPAAERMFMDEARALYRLLIQPAEGPIAASQRVLIVPDGPLHSLPFGSLIAGDGQYLIYRKAIHSVLSLTTYAELQKGRQNRPAYRYELAAFGDPHYPAGGGDLAKSGDAGLRRTAERGFVPTPLPLSRIEVQSIAHYFPGRSRVYLGAAASEDAAKALSAEARYVHFAAHGLLDEQFPLDSALVLSIPDQIRPGEDNGLLQAWEIFQMVRWNSELVVLSACRTALGRELGGEGLVGLTRAIQYAGARSVLATLWSVDDRRTAALMRTFYARLAAGDSKDEAIRAAQLEMLKSRATARPAYWAGFTLSGDWR